MITVCGIPLLARDRVRNTLRNWHGVSEDFTRDEWVDLVTYAVEQARKFPLVPILRLITWRLRRG